MALNQSNYIQQRDSCKTSHLNKLSTWQVAEDIIVNPVCSQVSILIQTAAGQGGEVARSTADVLVDGGAPRADVKEGGAEEGVGVLTDVDACLPCALHKSFGCHEGVGHFRANGRQSVQKMYEVLQCYTNGLYRRCIKCHTNGLYRRCMKC